MAEGLRSWRVAVADATVEGIALAVAYADLFAVVRPGSEAPGPSDWEVTLISAEPTALRPGRYRLVLDLHGGGRVEGFALLRLREGCRHLFRGDSDATGLRDVVV